MDGIRITEFSGPGQPSFHNQDPDPGIVYSETLGGLGCRQVFGGKPPHVPILTFSL